MGKTPRTVVSPKVTSATVTSAATVVVLYVLGQLPYVQDLPAQVTAALMVLLTAAATFVAGYVKRDPARNG